MILVPLSRLVLRHWAATCARPRACHPELARIHPARGPAAKLLIVIPAADGLHYEVVAGGRWPR